MLICSVCELVQKCVISVSNFRRLAFLLMIDDPLIYNWLAFCREKHALPRLLTCFTCQKPWQTFADWSQICLKLVSNWSQIGLKLVSNWSHALTIFFLNLSDSVSDLFFRRHKACLQRNLLSGIFCLKIAILPGKTWIKFRNIAKKEGEKERIW